MKRSLLIAGAGLTVKAVAAMSPIHDQKRLRLQEARRRLLAGKTSAEAVTYEVGYASPSQLSRECVRLFGQPPRRDAERTRGVAEPRLSNRMEGERQWAHHQ